MPWEVRYGNRATRTTGRDGAPETVASGTQVARFVSVLNGAFCRVFVCQKSGTDSAQMVRQTYLCVFPGTVHD